MTIIALNDFAGQSPRVNPRQLAPNMAQKAINTKLWSTLEPFRDVTAVVTPTKVGANMSIYRLGQGLAETQFWMTWATDVDVVRGQIAGDTTERTYYTGDGVPKVTDATLCTTGGTNYPMVSYTLGVPKPISSPVVTISGTGTGLPSARSYVFTYVSAWGEESQPCSPTVAQNILFGQTAALSSIPVAPTGAFNIATKRIYRTSTGTYGTAFLFVGEIPVATTTFADTVLDADLGETIPSNTWLMPPATMQGLIALPNGVMAGFSANEVMLCEPYKPYAWPLANMQSTDYPIVAIGHYGGVLVIGTTGTPYMLVGVDPANTTMQKMEIEQACVSKRSMVSMGAGVCYASPDGLVYASGGGAILATKNHFTRDDWQKLNPSSIHAYLLDGRYFGFYNTGTVSGGFIYSPDDGVDGFVMLDTYATSGYVDPVLDSLYLMIGANIIKWDAHATLKKTRSWKSKVFVLPKPCNMSCAQAVAAAYPLTMNIYADGVLKRTQTVTDDKPFRLPSGFLARDWEVEIVGTTEIYAIYLAESITELAHG
jgi:hypothetical protein